MAASTTPNLRTICKALGSVKHKWFKLGIMLDIPHENLEEFSKKDDPLSAVINYFLKNITDPLVPISWETIVEVLKSEYVGEPGLGGQIHKDYVKSGAGQKCLSHCIVHYCELPHF